LGVFLVKKRRFVKSKSGNRKISRLAKKEMLIRRVIKALRLGFFYVILVNPNGSTNSGEHEILMREGEGL